MIPLDPGTTDVIMAWLTGAMTLATCIMAAISAWSVQEMKRARLEASRPVVELSVEVRRGGLYCLVVRNIGGGIALNVRVKVPKDLKRALEGNQSARIVKMDSVNLRLLPGQEALYAIGTKMTIDITKLPVSTFELSYSSLSGKQYIESVEIDFPGLGPRLIYCSEIFEAIKPLTEEIRGVRRDLDKMGNTLRGIKGAIDALKQDDEDERQGFSA